MVKPFLQPALEVRQFHSHILNQGMHLTIKLPWGYERGEKSSPVLYCLDANRPFSFYSMLSSAAEKPGFTAQDIMIVGINLPDDDKDHTSPVTRMKWGMQELFSEGGEKMSANEVGISSLPVGGKARPLQFEGAHRLLRSLKEEIIPLIETNFRASSTGRGLAGCSYGGSFTLFALFTETPLFERYFASSPTTLDTLFEFEAYYASKHADLNARLLLTASSEDPDSLEFLRRMVASLQARMFPGFKLLAHVFEDERNSSAYIASVRQALKELYEGIVNND